MSKYRSLQSQVKKQSSVKLICWYRVWSGVKMGMLSLQAHDVHVLP